MPADQEIVCRVGGDVVAGVLPDGQDVVAGADRTELLGEPLEGLRAER